MQTGRWQKIEEIFYQAVALPANERQSFVTENCGDAELCREINALLFEDSQDETFLNEPIFSVGLQLIENDYSKLMETGDFGRYKLLELLGRGGMGAVFLAEDTTMERYVALKVLPPDVAENPDAMARFRQEAKAASAFSHPNIAHIYEFGNSNGRYFLAMEYVRGRTLRELIKDKLIDGKLALKFAFQTAAALQAAHARGIVHRDIKPENIIVTDDNLVKVLDFGLAKLDDAPEFNQTNSLETIPRMIIGTAAYMSPEQVRGQRLDGRTDVWSLGVMLYEMLAGSRPFKGDTPSDLQAAILRDKVPPHLPNEKLNREFFRLINKCLQKDRLKRFQTASDFIAEAKTVQSSFNKKTPRQNWQLRDWGLKAVLPLILIVGGFFGVSNLTDYFSRQSKQITESPAVLESRQIKSLVVPPFQNMTNDGRLNFLSEGLAEDLTRSLGSLNRIRIVSYSSARKIKNVEDSAFIKNNLAADSILRGRVEGNGEHLFINVELIDTNDGTTVWQQRLNAATGDFLKLRNALTIVISNEFQTLTGGEKKLVAADYGTRSNEAFLKYLTGKYAPDRSTKEGLHRAIEPLKQAIELDPNYALARVALADAYNLLGTWYGEKPDFYQPLAKQTIEKALAIDESLSEAHTTLAKIKMDYERDFSGAEREFKRAIALNPNNALAHHWYGEVYLSAMGRLDESLRELEIARELNPLSSGVLTALAWTHIGRKDYEQAIKMCDAATALNAEDTGAYSFKAMALLKLERFDEAIAAIEKAIQRGDGWVELGVIYGTSGQTAKAQEALRRLEQKKQADDDVSDYDLAVIYAAIGNRDRAFELLEKQAQTKSVDLLSMRIDPLLDSLRDDPRFAALEAKMNFPD